MNASALATIWAAIIAGLVALTGYLSNQSANRRERKSKVFAEALEAIRDYQELPYRIRRRPNSDGETRADLGRQTGDAMSRLWYYRGWLETESAAVSAAYRDLMAETKRHGGEYRAKAWSEPVIMTDSGAQLTDKYLYDNKPELALYLMTIRRELSHFAFLLRPSTRRQLRLQREKRRAEQ